MFYKEKIAKRAAAEIKDGQIINLGIGGGMELAQKARRLIITTTHTIRDGKAENSGTL